MDHDCTIIVEPQSAPCIVAEREVYGCCETEVDHAGQRWMVRRRVTASGVCIEVFEPTTLLADTHAVRTLQGGRWWGRVDSERSQPERARKSLILALAQLVYPGIVGTYMGGFLFI